MRGQSPQEKQNNIDEYSKIMITPIDVKKLNADLHESVTKYFKGKGKPIEEGTEYKLHGTSYLGVVTGTNIVTDDECIHKVSADGHYKLQVGWKIDNKSGMSFSMVPVLENTCPIAELIEEYGLPEITLVEFMGSRFNYNDRIASNMKGLKKATKQAPTLGS